MSFLLTNMFLFFLAGWIKTFEDYYRRQTKNILTLMTNALAEDSRKKFIWAEISYLDLWWRDQSDTMKERFKRLACNGIYVAVAEATYVCLQETDQ